MCFLGVLVFCWFVGLCVLLFWVFVENVGCFLGCVGFVVLFVGFCWWRTLKI